MNVVWGADEYTLDKKVLNSVSVIGPEYKNPNDVGRWVYDIGSPTPKDLSRSIVKIGHHIYNSKRQVKQQMELQLVVNGLQVITNKIGYNELGI